MHKLIGIGIVSYCLSTALIGCIQAPSQSATTENLADTQAPHTLSILTYNVGLFELNLFGMQVMKPADYLQQRLHALPDALISSNADVIALQEIFLSSHQEFVIDALKDTYPYALYQTTKSPRIHSGLMILSKYPLTNSSYHSSKDAGPFDERLIIQSGFLQTQIQLSNDRYITMVNMHPSSGGLLSAQDSASNIAMRSNQISQAMTLVKDKPAVVVGDFNCGPEIAQKNYTIAKNNGYTDSYLAWTSQNKRPAKITWDNKNPLNLSGTHAESVSQRIDHIFLSKSLTNQTQLLHSKRVFDVPSVAVEKGKVTISDHYGIQTLVKLL